MTIFTVKLLIAHIIGDFVFQPDGWVKDKNEHKHKSKYLYLHVLVHVATLLLVLEFDLSKLPYISGIAISHLLIDLLKLNLNARISSRILFFADQLLHLAVIGLVVYLHYPLETEFKQLYSGEVMLLILAILLTTSVSAVVMKVLLGKWSLEEDNREDSLPNAGKYIGILERLFVFGFIVMNQWSAIGLLIAAKSVFRFSDLSRAKDRKLTEYILIGTLISFGMAISIGLMYNLVRETLLSE